MNSRGQGKAGSRPDILKQAVLSPSRVGITDNDMMANMLVAARRNDVLSVWQLGCITLVLLRATRCAARGHSLRRLSSCCYSEIIVSAVGITVAASVLLVGQLAERAFSQATGVVSVVMYCRYGRQSGLSGDSCTMRR